jgi:catechol 2,3-dioxygenase-like lactoylglutathione lyase family enzyme
MSLSALMLRTSRCASLARVAIFKTPQIVLFTRDLVQSAEFYRALGFEEVFRTPREGTPIHIDLELDGYRIGLAGEGSTREDHGLDPVAAGQRAAVVLWTEDTPAAYARLQEVGATPVKAPEPWLERLLIAWAEDPDGHLIQVVQSTADTAT